MILGRDDSIPLMKFSEKENHVTKQPLISVLTAVYNNAAIIEEAITSVRSQSYQNIEYVVVDGGSTDGTKDILKRHESSIDICISEPDDGLYDALNKAIRLATGEYIIFLHSDDVFHNTDSLQTLVTKVLEKDAEICLSSVVITDKEMRRIIRHYPPYKPTKWLFRIGCMPPHPGCLFKRSLHNDFGYYSTQYKIAGDFDFLVRMFFARTIRWTRVTNITTRMRRGGKSNDGLNSKIDIMNEVHTVLQSHNIYSNRVLQLFRYVLRAFEFLPRRKVSL